MDNLPEINPEISLKVSAQFLRQLYSRLVTILSIYSEGYLLVINDQIEEIYIKLRNAVESTLKSFGFEQIAKTYPLNIIPRTLHSLGEDADIYWESNKDEIYGYSGQLIEFCVSIDATDNNINSGIKQILEGYDQVIQSFNKYKKDKENNWLKKAEKAGTQYKEQSSQNFEINRGNYVNLSRIDELRSISSKLYDLTKLIQLCVELNKAFNNESYMAATMLLRSILDHIPPIFGCKNFTEVANNHSLGSKSFKESMMHLDLSSRKIADSYLHTQIRDKEILPNKTQVNFSNDLDFLLAEIIRLLK